MKIFRICPEPPYLRKFRKFHYDSLFNKPYDEQIALFRRENILLPGGWAAAMEAEGFEVFETIYGDTALMAHWAIENGHHGLITQTTLQELILKEMVRSFNPDVIFIYAGVFFRLPPDFREALRHCCSKNIIMTGFWGDELPHGLTYRDYFHQMDFVFCSSTVYEKTFIEAGIPTMTIGNCFDNTIPHKPAPTKVHPFIFSGTTGYNYPDHVGRYEKIIDLMHKTNLEIWANERPDLFATRIRKLFRVICARLIDGVVLLPNLCLRVLQGLTPSRHVRHLTRLAVFARDAEVPGETMFLPPKGAHPLSHYFDRRKPLRKLFPKRVHRLLMNSSEYYTMVESAQIVLNLHRDEKADIGNIRCFEVTGLGSLLVTDRGQELAEFLEPDVDFVAFETIDECVQKVDYLLANPAELQRIATNGQAKTLFRHTVRHRCHQIAEKLHELTSDSPSTVIARSLVVDAVYDLNHHPISYDISFFLQASEIYRKKQHANDLQITIVWPQDIDNMPGVSKEADAAVDAAARAFRINHICGQMAELMPSKGVTHIRTQSQQADMRLRKGLNVLPYPLERDHHTAYFRAVMADHELMTGFSASIDAHRYIRTWLEPLRANRKVITVTLRQYAFDVERNSNIEAWAEFLEPLDKREYAIVIVPDTDHIEEFKASKLKVYPSFEPVCFDVDLRLALYEQAFLNMFINNGPCVAATLDKNVNYLMFKIITPSVPHCTEDFIRWSGFEIGENPPYAGPYQKWVWEDDTVDVLWREFIKMRDKILKKEQVISTAETHA